MNVSIIPWSENDQDVLESLYIKFPYPPYWGSPIISEKLQAYRYKNVRESALSDPESFLVCKVRVSGKIACAAQILRLDHLSDQFGIEVAGLTNEAFLTDNSDHNYKYFLELITKLREVAKRRGFVLLSASAASPAFHWIRALEENGFRYADGFLHLSSSSKDNYDAFLIKDLVVRDPIDTDFDEIAFSYEKAVFPSHWLYEPEFDKERMVKLYVRRYREVWEQGLGKLFIGELNGEFASALISMIDKEIQKETGLIVNSLSMGIVVHPRAARKGVSLSLVAYRHNWYRGLGLEYGYFGANINNYQMIRGLEKMGMRFCGINNNYILRLR